MEINFIKIKSTILLGIKALMGRVGSAPLQERNRHRLKAVLRKTRPKLHPGAQALNKVEVLRQSR